MKILFVGDVVGRVGRNVVKQRVPALRRKEAVDFVVVNVENAAGGYGVTPAVAEEFFRLGADVLTSGNHVWDQKEILEYLDRQPKLLRPANYPPTLPGEGVWVGRTAGGVDVAVVNLQGRVFMPLTDCPFRRAD
ncbi:MAG TPA: YmdB family metallophosphoesterase, partial [Acidobacteriota bacterium]|nr:YmdB family metallophosphoesterase [Acidobacteriota bacterium]